MSRFENRQELTRRNFIRTAAILGAATSMGAAQSMPGGPSVSDSDKRKKVVRIKHPPQGHWVGNGFPVRTMISYNDEPAEISPFLLLDFAAPATFPGDGRRRGVGEHPHRGFETVTIAYQGEVEHRDSGGNKGRIGPGDIQWMTAASGVVHEEMHGKEFSKAGGTFEMAQIWVNLPAKLKMSKPKYQDILAKQVGLVKLDGEAGSIRVIAGECMKVKGPAATHTPVNLWDLHLNAGGSVELAIPAGYTTMLLARRGSVVVNGDTTLKEANLAILDRKGETFHVASPDGADVLVLGGEPIPEPVVGHGPFVMNTWEEIERAMSDYRQGRMGRLPD